MLGAIIVGILAGWLAGKLIRGRGYGIIGDLVLGLPAQRAALAIIDKKTKQIVAKYGF